MSVEKIKCWTDSIKLDKKLKKQFKKVDKELASEHVKDVLEDPAKKYKTWIDTNLITDDSSINLSIDRELDISQSEIIKKVEQYTLGASVDLSLKGNYDHEIFIKRISDCDYSITIGKSLGAKLGISFDVMEEALNVSAGVSAFKIKGYQFQFESSEKVANFFLRVFWMETPENFYSFNHLLCFNKEDVNLV